jgi:hypothetical protein
MDHSNPFDAPKSDVSKIEETHRNRELREWLGLTFADLLVYIALALAVAMLFFDNIVLNSVLGALAICISIASCPLGMKRDPEFSPLTNFAKLVSYPFFVLFVLVVITARCLGLNAHNLYSCLTNRSTRTLPPWADTSSSHSDFSSPSIAPQSAPPVNSIR